ncbi:hypothetical protein ACFQDG_08565 [Natronoarchaeum mannanilyticum]|uniref:DUF7261 family protein n=1 Tax=Natronoarchaeum mannanilyticum TaxID=926360 RepID=UPI0036216636
MVRVTRSDADGDDEIPASTRAQLVLVAGAVIAVGLAPIALAYVQLGATTDAGVGTADRTGEDVTRALDRAVFEAASGVPGNHSWSDRRDAVAAVENRLDPRLDTLRTSGLREGVVHGIEYNESAAGAWAAEGCPGGPNRQFGDGEPIGGVVRQDRGGRTHVLGVAVDLRVTGEESASRMTHRVDAAPQSAG